MALPLPFARAVVVLGPSLPADTPPEQLAEAIEAVNQAAEVALAAKTLPLSAADRL